MAQSLKQRIGNWAKSGRAFTQTGLNLMGEAIGEALAHGNLDPATRIIAALDERDAKDALTIFGVFLPVTVKDGGLTMQKNWQVKAQALPLFEREVGDHKSFRTFAAALRPEKDEGEKPAFDMVAYLKAFDKLNAKAAEGAVPADVVKRMQALAAEMHRLMESTEGAEVVVHPAIAKAA